MTLNSIWGWGSSSGHFGGKECPFIARELLLVKVWSMEQKVWSMGQIDMFISLKLVDKFTYLGSSVSWTETDIKTRLSNAWTAIDRLSVVWKSDSTNKTKHSFFQAAFVSILLYGCTTWMLTKRMEKKLDDNYTRMLWAILNKSWKQLPIKQQQQQQL